MLHSFAISCFITSENGISELQITKFIFSNNYFALSTRLKIFLKYIKLSEFNNAIIYAKIIFAFLLL